MAMATQIISYSIPVQAIQLSGIYREQPLLVAHLGRSFPLGGSWRPQPTSTAMANRISYFTMLEHVKQRSGTSTTTFWSTACTVRHCRRAEPRSRRRMACGDKRHLICRGLSAQHNVATSKSEQPVRSPGSAGRNVTTFWILTRMEHRFFPALRPALRQHSQPGRI